MRLLNFAVVDCGMLARQMHLPNLVTLEDAKLHTCCDIDEANLAASPDFQLERTSRDYREATADPEVDAFIVATTETFRVPIIHDYSLCQRWHATITMASTGSFGYLKELLEAMGQGAVVGCDHMLEVRTAGISGAAPMARYPMLNDRHPNVGRAGGLHGWLEKKRAACDEAAASDHLCSGSPRSPTRDIALC